MDENYSIMQHGNHVHCSQSQIIVVSVHSNYEKKQKLKHSKLIVHYNLQVATVVDFSLIIAKFRYFMNLYFNL